MDNKEMKDYLYNRIEEFEKKANGYLEAGRTKPAENWKLKKYIYELALYYLKGKEEKKNEKI